MAGEIADMISSLTPQEQEAVREFIGFIRSRNEATSSSFLTAVDEFIEEHPDLLQRLAR